MSEKNHIPFLFEEFLSKKKITFQSFFNLEDIPHNIKHLPNTDSVLKDVKYKTKDVMNEMKDILYFNQNDMIDNVKSSIRSSNSSLEDVLYYIEELEKIIEHWEIAYSSLEELTLEMINKEDIDISNYSVNISDTDLKIYNRIKSIRKLLGK